MKKCIWLFVFLYPLFSEAQELIWEKKIRFSNYETFLSVIKTSDLNYLVAGYTERWRIITPQNVYGGASFTKFNDPFSEEI